MVEAKDIKGIFTGIILIAVLGFAANMIIGMTPTAQNYATVEREFNTADEWTLSSTGVTSIAHTGENLHVTASGSGSGTITLTQEIEIDEIGKGISEATAEVATITDNMDNLVSENNYGRLIDPHGNVDFERINVTGESPMTEWVDNSYDVADVIDEEGTWTVELFSEVQVDGDSYSHYIDNVSLEATAELDQLTVVDKLGQYGPYLVMILVMSLFVGGIAVLLNKLNVL